MGSQKSNNLDVLVYDKMSMAPLYYQAVKGTMLEEVLDRMEAKNAYEGMPKLDAFLPPTYNINCTCKYSQ